MATYPPGGRQPFPRARAAGAGKTNGNGHGNGNGNGNGNNNRYPRGNGNGYLVAGATFNETVYEILHVLFKRWRLIAVLFLIVALPGLIGTATREKKYLATGKVLIAADRADLQIQPTELTALTQLKLNEAVVNSEVHIIRSYELLKSVATRLELQEAGGIVAVANAADNDRRIGMRALQLSRRLEVKPVRASNVIAIEYVSPNPGEAAHIVNQVIDEYLVRHAQVHGQTGRLSTFYEEQGRLLEQNVRQAEQNLRDFALREGIVAPEVELRTAVESVSQIEQARRRVGAEIAEMEEQLRTVREQLAQQPPLVKHAQLLEVNPVVQRLSEQLTNRRITQIALLRKYTEKARPVRDNQQEIAELEAELGKVLRDKPTVVSEQVFRANPVYDQRLNALLSLEASLEGHRARLAVLEESEARVRRQLVALKEKALEFDRLSKDVERRRSLHEVYLKRQQEAQVSDAMDRERLVNVEVVQRPAPPLPRVDKRGASFLLAILSGLAVSIGGAFGAEYLNRTLRFERDVESALGLPVLATVTDARQS